MPQFLRPTSDISVGGWTTAPLYAKLYETSPDDATTEIRSAKNPSADTFEVGLSAPGGTPANRLNHILRVRLSSGSKSGYTANITLLQESTTIQAFTGQAVPTTYGTLTLNVTEANAQNISNYAALRVRVSVSGGQGGYGYCTWSELQIPDALIVKTGTASISGGGALTGSARKGAKISFTGIPQAVFTDDFSGVDQSPVDPNYWDSVGLQYGYKRLRREAGELRWDYNPGWGLRKLDDFPHDRYVEVKISGTLDAARPGQIWIDLYNDQTDHWFLHISKAGGTSTVLVNLGKERIFDGWSYWFSTILSYSNSQLAGRTIRVVGSGSVFSWSLDGVVQQSVSPGNGFDTATGKVGFRLEGSDRADTSIDDYRGGYLISSLISARGSLVLTGVHTFLGNPVVSGGGALTVQAKKAVSGAAAISGGGSLTVVGLKSVSIQATISGGGSIIAGSGAPKFGNPVISGGGAVVSTGRKGATKAIALSGGGVVSATERKGARIAAAISVAGATAAAILKNARGAALLSGGGTLYASAQENAYRTVLISGGGAISATGLASGRHNPIISGNGAVVAAGRKNSRIWPQISGGGTLSTAGFSTQVTIKAPVLRGGGALTVVGKKAARGFAFFRGGGRLGAYGSHGWPYIPELPHPGDDSLAYLVKMKLDFCGLTFGVAPCNATGTPCYNTWKTCRYLSAYSPIPREYRFCSVDFPQLFPDARPYVSGVRLLPTEIKTNLTISGRVIVDMVDEPDTDVGMDPYIGEKYLPALNFDGTTGLVVSGDPIPNQYPVAYEYWVKPSQFRPGSFSYALTNKRASTASGTRLGSYSASQNMVWVENNYWFTSIGDLSVGKWDHIVVSFNAANRVDIWINGAFDAGLTYPSGQSSYSDGVLFLGSGWGATDLPLLGALATARVYNGLTVDAGIAAALYNAGKGLVDPSAVATPSVDFRFDEGSGSVVRSAVSNHTATLVPGVTWTEGPVVMSSGSRTPSPASFWKRFLARNVNYKGRIIEVYEGVPGAPETSFSLRWRGKLDNVKISGSKISVESVDLLKDLSKVDVPPKYSTKTITPLAISEVGAMSVDKTEDFPEAGYLLVDEEIIQYGAKSDATRQFLNLTRGAFGTVAADHSEREKVSPVRYYPPQSGFDLLLEMVIVDGEENEFEVRDSASFILPSNPDSGYLFLDYYGSGVAGWGSRGYVRVSSGGMTEIFYFTRNEYFDAGGGVFAARLTIDLSRRPLWGTDLLGEISVGDTAEWIDGAVIELDAFDYYRDFPEPDVLFSAVLTDPRKLSDLFFEVVDLLDCKVWVAENLKITIRRNIQNLPGRTYHAISDGDDIEFESGAVDLNEKSRITRYVIYWEKNPIGKHDDTFSYKRVEIAINPDAEFNYDGPVEKKVYCPWISTLSGNEDLIGRYVRNLGLRRVLRQKDAQPVISLSLANKGTKILTGDYVRLSTDEVLDEFGNPTSRRIYQVVRRGKSSSGVDLKLIQVAQSRICIISPDGLPDYPSATESQREYGFISDDGGLMSDGEIGYFIW